MGTYHDAVAEDPLRVALEEISPKLKPELRRLMAAFLAGNPLDESWQRLLQEILDEA